MEEGGGGGEDEEEEESSGKTLMELLELEMRARAIKALLKKEEEGEEGDDGDEWPLLPTVAQDDAIQRPLLKAAESDFSDKQQQQTIGHGHHQHQRPADPSVSTKVYAVNQQPAGLYRAPPALLAGQQQSGRRRHSSSVRRDDDRNDNEMGFRKSQQTRHYRHHHHHHHHQQQQQHYHHRRHSSDHDRDRSRSASLRDPVKTEPIPTSEPDRKPSPFLSTPPVVEPVPTPPAAAVDVVQLEKAEMIPIALMKSNDDDVEGDDEYEEEYGIQEVDIELGSGSECDDDAHSARI